MLCSLNVKWLEKEPIIRNQRNRVEVDWTEQRSRLVERTIEL